MRFLILTRVTASSRSCPSVHTGPLLGMPKNKAAKGQNKKKKELSAAAASTTGPVTSPSDDVVRISVSAVPGSSSSSVASVGEESVRVRIGAPPVDGEANAELIKFLAKVLRLRKSDLNLVSGARGRTKTVEVRAPTAATGVQDVLEKLKEQVS